MNIPKTPTFWSLTLARCSYSHYLQSSWLIHASTSSLSVHENEEKNIKIHLFFKTKAWP